MNDASFHIPGETQALIDGYFDDELSAAEASRLERLIATDPAVALALARAGLFADRLHGVLATDGVARGARASAAGPRAPVTTRSALQRVVAVVAALALAVVVAVLLRQSSGTASAAGVALDRIVTAAASSGDREYRIHVLDHGPHGRPAPVPSGGQGRKPGIDGARLFVRGADRFVLIRRFGDGSEFVTGSDGTIGWSVPPRGHVHLSDDVRRFRRAVPGEHEEVPFIDLRGGLDGLRRGYDLSLSAGADGVRTLHAVLQPGRRGVERVDVLFDDAGVATRIVIEGLPADEGAPRAVELELVSTRDPGDAFFGHEAHHAAGRPTQWE